MNPVFMQEAIRLSEQGMRAGAGGPFGAVIVKDGEIIGRGCHQVLSGKDPTAHAEVVAIRQACQKLGNFDLAGCEIYCSCEPCPMCLAAIMWARLDRVYYAAGREDAAAAGFDDQIISQEILQPRTKRRMRMEQSQRTEALSAFAEWRGKPDKKAG